MLTDKQCYLCHIALFIIHNPRVVTNIKPEGNGRFCSHVNNWLCYDCYRLKHDDKDRWTGG